MAFMDKTRTCMFLFFALAGVALIWYLFSLQQRSERFQDGPEAIDKEDLPDVHKKADDRRRPSLKVVAEGKEDDATKATAAAPLYTRRVLVMKLFDALLMRKATHAEIEKYSGIGAEADIVRRIVEDYHVEDADVRKLAKGDSTDAAADEPTAAKESPSTPPQSPMTATPSDATATTPTKTPSDATMASKTPTKTPPDATMASKTPTKTPSDATSIATMASKTPSETTTKTTDDQTDPQQDVSAQARLTPPASKAAPPGKKNKVESFSTYMPYAELDAQDGGGYNGRYAMPYGVVQYASQRAAARMLGPSDLLPLSIHEVGAPTVQTVGTTQQKKIGRVPIEPADGSEESLDHQRLVVDPAELQRRIGAIGRELSVLQQLVAY